MCTGTASDLSPVTHAETGDTKKCTGTLWAKPTDLLSGLPLRSRVTGDTKKCTGTYSK